MFSLLSVIPSNSFLFSFFLNKFRRFGKERSSLKEIIFLSQPVNNGRIITTRV